MAKDDKLYCWYCDALLNKKKAVWLELSMETGKWGGKIPENESQGFFPFGKACAKRVLKESEY